MNNTIQNIVVPLELLRKHGNATACIYGILHATAREGVCTISRNEIKKYTNFSIRTIVYALKTLEEHGLITRLEAPGEVPRYRVSDIISDGEPKSELPSKQLQEEHPKKKRYGRYGWVGLTDAEYQELVEKYGERKTTDCIEAINNSIESRKMYKNMQGISKGDFNYAYVAEWIRKDATKEKNKEDWAKIKKGQPIHDSIRDEEMKNIEQYLKLVE